MADGVRWVGAASHAAADGLDDEGEDVEEDEEGGEERGTQAERGGGGGGCGGRRGVGGEDVVKETGEEGVEVSVYPCTSAVR